MKVLLVEDDEFKAADLSKMVAEIAPRASIEHVSSANTALRAITEHEYDLIILDMSLPTFDLTGPGGGGAPQGQGGLDVMRLANILSIEVKFLVVTQYPDIEFDGKEVPLNQASKVIRASIGVDVIGCFLYDFEGDSWRAPLRNQLLKIAEAN